MEYIVGEDGSLMPDPEYDIGSEELARVTAAMDFYRESSEGLGTTIQRVGELGLSGANTTIALIDTTDPEAVVLADYALPEWRAHQREGTRIAIRGVIAKGLALDFLELAGHLGTAEDLRSTDELRIVVVAARTAVVLRFELGTAE